MDSFTDIISAWPSRQDCADDLGVALSRVHKWAQRDQIPGEFDCAVVAALARRGVDLSFERIAQLRSKARTVDNCSAGDEAAA